MIKNIFLILKTVALASVVFLLSSCLHTVRVTSDTFADQKAIPCGFRYGSSFFIKSARKDNQLFAKEVTYKIERILNDQGYSVVQSSKDADYCLIFTFDSNKYKETRDVPVYEPGEVTVTKGYSCGRRDCVQYQEETSTPGKLFFVKKDFLMFDKNLMIEVYDAKLYRETKRQDQLWKASAFNCSEENNLREAVDYLLVSAFSNFGRSTGRSVNMQLSENDMKKEKARLGLS